MIYAVRTLIIVAVSTVAMAIAGLFSNHASLKPAEPPASKSQASPGVEPAYYVASEIGKTYHRPDCFYAAKQTKHRIVFESKSAAEASGRKPCTNCLPGFVHSP